MGSLSNNITERCQFLTCYGSLLKWPPMSTMVEYKPLSLKNIPQTGKKYCIIEEKLLNIWKYKLKVGLILEGIELLHCIQRSKFENLQRENFNSRIIPNYKKIRN